MATKDDIYIQALEYAESKTSFTLDDLSRDLKLTPLQTTQFAKQIHEKQIFFQGHSNYFNNFEEASDSTQKLSNTSNVDLFFSVDDKFKLISYNSLKDARASSRQSTCYATAALIISIVTAAISIYYANAQLKADINIPEEFVSKIKNINQKQDEISSTLIFIKNNGLNSASGSSKKH